MCRLEETTIDETEECSEGESVSVICDWLTNCEFFCL